jgi:hypothetical protein
MYFDTRSDGDIGYGKDSDRRDDYSASALKRRRIRRLMVTLVSSIHQLLSNAR